MMIVTKRKMERKQTLIYIPKNNFRNTGGVVMRTLAHSSVDLSPVSYTDALQRLLRKSNCRILILLAIPKQACSKSNCCWQFLLKLQNQDMDVSSQSEHQAVKNTTLSILCIGKGELSLKPSGCSPFHY